MTEATRGRLFGSYSVVTNQRNPLCYVFMKELAAILHMSLRSPKLARCTLIALFALLPVGTGLIAFMEGLSVGEAHSLALITGLTLEYGDLSPVTLWGHLIIILIGVSVTIADQVIRLVAPDNRRRDNR